MDVDFSGRLGLAGGANFAGVDEVAKLFAGLEERDTLGRNGDGSAGLGVAASARIALAGAEAAKAPDFNLVIGFKGSDDRFEEGIDDDLTVTAG